MPDPDYKAAAAAAAAAWQAAVDTVATTRQAIKEAEAEIIKTAPAAVLTAGGDLAKGAAARIAALAHQQYLQEALTAAEEHAADLLQKNIAAQAEVHRPAFNAGIARRIAATAAADKARADLETAEAEFKAATAAIQRTHAAGLPRPCDGAELLRPMTTEDQERAFWDAVL